MANFPHPVAFNERGKQVFLILTVHGLKTKKPSFFRSEETPINATIEPPTFDTGYMSIHCTVTTPDGKDTEYEYAKELPSDVKPKHCRYEVGRSQIIVTLAKRKKQSWAPQAADFLRP